ncbi:MAG: hypothetical protein R3C28_09915 [Pirellulaceae bacterium]
MQAIWERLLAGDPGPLVALFDALLDADLNRAAGGLLDDVAERILLADEQIEDVQQIAEFARAAKAGLLQCCDGDEEELRDLMERVQRELDEFSG